MSVLSTTQWKSPANLFLQFSSAYDLRSTNKFFLSIALFGAYRLVSCIGTSFTFIFAEVNLPFLSTLYDNIVNSTFSLNKMITPLDRCVPWLFTFTILKPFVFFFYVSTACFLKKYNMKTIIIQPVKIL